MLYVCEQVQLQKVILFMFSLCASIFKFSLSILLIRQLSAWIQPTSRYFLAKMSAGSLTPTEIKYMEEHSSDDRGPNLIVCGVISLVFAYLVVGSRILSHHIGGVAWGVDDTLILIELVSRHGPAALI